MQMMIILTLQHSFGSRGPLYQVVLLVALFSACGGTPEPSIDVDSDASRLPNVIFIVADTLRADATTTKVNGEWLMPNIRALADESLEFTNATSHESFTLPSMVSTLTSLYPEVHGIGHQIITLDGNMVNPAGQAKLDHLTLLPTYFKELGYQTAGVQTNPHLRPRAGFDRGFDEYFFRSAIPAEQVVSRALASVAKMREPYFLYVHFLDTHVPFERRRHYDSKVGPFPDISRRESRALNRSFMDFYRDVIRSFLEDKEHQDFGELSPEGREYAKRMFYGEAVHLDTHIGRMFERLRKEGKLDEDDVVIFTSDHGDEYWEHGTMGHSKTVYQEVIHIPFMLRLPGVEPRRVEAPVESVDLLPTLAAFFDIDPDPLWQGRDLVAGMSDGLDPARPRFAQARGVFPAENIKWDGVRVRDLKYLYGGAQDEEWLFDLAADPGETKNLVDERPAAAEEMRAALERYKASSAEHPMAQVKRVYEEVDPETLEALRAIGYVE